jgi:hypothetical protein
MKAMSKKIEYGGKQWKRRKCFPFDRIEYEESNLSFRLFGFNNENSLSNLMCYNYFYFMFLLSEISAIIYLFLLMDIIGNVVSSEN